ncbi:MAG: heavy metal translocating P-type ATPase [Oligoflexia bacterium]|nr:heavy metal translocating P-type ATPase [Oligoflexia bacterium]
MNNSAVATQDVSCLHCGNPSLSGNSFCCSGCESVYSFLHTEGLEHFYQLREQFSFRSQRKRIHIAQNVFPLTNELEKSHSLQLYIEGIHCLGCLWLLEKLPDFLPKIKTASLDLDSNILTITRKTNEYKWNNVIQKIHAFGYDVKIIENNLEEIKASDTKKQLARIGIAAFSAGNIMLLSISIYGGADPYWGIRFGWLSLIFSIPSLTYSAWPIYKNTLLSIKNKMISVDSAIVLALIAGTVISIWSLINNNEQHIYLDSLSMLVFFLLSSRFFLQRIREKIGKESPLLNLLKKEFYQVNRDGITPLSIAASDIAINDKITLALNQVTPVDSKLINDSAYFDFSLLTGESSPVKLFAGEVVESGAICLSEDAYVQSLSKAKDSRFAKILDQIRAKKMLRTKSIDFADRVAKYFVFFVLLVSASIIFIDPTETGFQKALALVIVSCPCVLAFSIPLATTKALQLSAKKGILLVNAEKLDALSRIKQIFFDKTGTLTTGNFEMLKWTQLQGDILQTQQIVKTIEQQSSHPIARSIVKNLTNVASLDNLSSYKEIPGIGVEGSILGSTWRVQKNPHVAAISHYRDLSLVVLQNGSTVAEIQLGDKVREEALPTVSKLRSIGYKLHILSGDSFERVRYVANKLSIKNWHAELLPEEKSKIISTFQDSIMIGDGINDAIAFQVASVGISMQGALEESAKNSDIIFTKPGLNNILTTLQIAKRTKSIILGNFTISLLYNAIGSVLAILGIISPLWAAVLMPLSSLSVFLLTHIQMERGFE